MESTCEDIFNSSKIDIPDELNANSHGESCEEGTRKMPFSLKIMDGILPTKKVEKTRKKKHVECAKSRDIHGKNDP